MIKKILAALLIIAMSKPLLISGIISQSDSIPGALASPLEEEPNLPDGLRPEAEIGLDDFLISRMGQKFKILGKRLDLTLNLLLPLVVRW